MSWYSWAFPLKGEENVMSSFYNGNPKRLEGIDTEHFIAYIEWRLYTEWCGDKMNWGKNRKYKGEAFEKWVQDEEYYAQERAGSKLNSQEIRAKVLKAVVLRAIEFFKDCKDYLLPAEGNTQNLRVSLKPYLQQLSDNIEK